MPVQQSYPKLLINMLSCVVRIFMNQTLFVTNLSSVFSNSSSRFEIRRFSAATSPSAFKRAFSLSSNRWFAFKSFSWVWSKSLKKNWNSWLDCLCRIWQYGLWNFQTGDTKLARFLPKNQHTQRKLLNFENWINWGLRSFQKSGFWKSIIFILPFT